MSFHVLVFVVSGEPEASGVGLRNLRMALVSCGAVAWRVTRRVYGSRYLTERGCERGGLIDA